MKIRKVLVPTKVVSTTVPAELMSILDRIFARKCITRADFVRRAIFKLATEEGHIKVTFDKAGDVYDLDLLEGAAA